MAKKSRLRKVNLVWFFLIALALFSLVSIANGTNRPKIPSNLSPPNGTFIYIINITCNGSTDADGDDINYTVIATIFNESLGIENRTLITNLTNTTFYLWNVTLLPSQEAVLRCWAYDGFNYSVESINSTIIIDRAPVLVTNIPNITIEEDTSGSLNLSQYFNDTDGDILNYSYTVDDNLTILINETTDIATITPDADFYGERNATFTAIDPYGLNITGNNFTVIVYNTPEVSLSSPVNGSSNFYANTSITFKVTVNDISNISNCSLYVNGTLNQTETNVVTAEDGVWDDNGTNTSSQKISKSDIGNINKFLDLASTNFIQIKMFVSYTNSPVDPIKVNINNENVVNITSSDISATCGGADNACWVSKSFAKPPTFMVGINNISLTAYYSAFIGNYDIYIDNSTDYNRSNASVYGDINGEYMIRLISSTNTLGFNPLSLSKGPWNWSSLCYNNESRSKWSETWELTVQNTAPEKPTFVNPTSGSYDNQINISCGGSTDIDGDDIYYNIRYSKESVGAGTTYTIITDDEDGNYTWNTSDVSGDNIKLICSATDGIDTSGNNEQAGFPLIIEHPGAPTTPTDILCNGGGCSGQAFGDEINISCNGSNDANSNFTYVIEAYYEDWNGTYWHTLNVVEASEGDEGYGNYTWNTISLMNQTGMKIGCYANDSDNAPSSRKTVEDVTIHHPGAPTIPAVLEPQTGTFDYEINITCNESSGAGDILYEAYAYYNNLWHLVNDSLTNTTVYRWNISSIQEQDINLKCRAYNSTYYSQFTQPVMLRIDREPTLSTILAPTAGVYEYILNYSCSGSNNSNYFLHYIDAYYDNGTLRDWHRMTDAFPGVPPVNDSELAYEDGDYIILEQTPSNKQRLFTVNVSEGDYSYCIRGYGTGNGPRFRLMWNCNYQGSCTDYDSSYTLLSASDTTYCSDVELTTHGLKYLVIQTRGDITSLATLTTYFDHSYLIAKPFQWNVTNVTRQKNVDFRCRAYDSRGNSSWFNPAWTISIDRIPVFNGTDEFSLAYGSTASHNLNEWFYDPDGDELEFSSTNSSHVYTTVNQTTDNITIRTGGPECSTSTVIEITSITADDNISNTTEQISVTVTGCPVPSGGGRRTVAEPEPEIVIIEPVPEPVEPTPEPIIEEPKPMPFPEKKPGIKAVIESPVIKKIFDTKIKHTREYYLSRGRTRIVEKIKNIGFYELDNILVKVSIPKAIAKSASEIVKVDEFTVIDDDPVIGFIIPIIGTNQEIEISYALNKRLTQTAISKIAVEIVPRELTPEEIAEKEKQVEEKIANTSRFVDITRTFTSDYEKRTTEFTINLSVKEDAILYNVDIFAEIPKCLVAILKEEMVESDVDFEIISEDPLIRWHFEKLTAKEKISYLIKKVSDENCTNQMTVMPLAHKIMILTKKVNITNAIIPLLLIPLIIILITTFSAFGFEAKERVIELSPLIKWARKTHKKGYTWPSIAKSMKITRRYSEEKIREVLRFSMNLPKLIMTKLDIDIEEGILILLIILNILDFMHLLPGEIDFAKKIISWTVLGYILFHASITRILFGYRSKPIDLAILLGYFMLIMKNLTEVAETGFVEAGFMKDLYAFIVNNNQFFETSLFIAGISFLVLASIYIASVKRISRKSLLGALGEFGESPHQIYKKTARFIFVFLTQLFFFVVVFNLMMEWLAIAVDAALLTTAIVFYLFILIKHRKKHWMLETVYKIGNIGEKFYEDFVELFHNRKTIFIGMTGMLMLHTLTEIGIFIIPYVLGIYNPLYLASWQQGHAPIFNAYAWLRNIAGIEVIGMQSLFVQGIIGMGIIQAAILFLAYSLNIIAIVFLLSIHVFVWYHLYKYRKLPVSEVPKLRFSGFTISLFIASFITFILAGAFKLKGLYFKGLMGVDILTMNIARNANLGLIIEVSFVAGLLAYVMMYAWPKVKDLLNWTIIVISFVFFFRYIFMFFTSVITYYASSIASLTTQNIFISLIMLIFMTLTIIFYTTGILAVGFELWLRNELGLRKIIRVKELPEWARHFDMSYIHHEAVHKEKKHGKKFRLLKEYILKEMRRGHSFSTVLLHLFAVGWSVKTIKEALAELNKNPEFRSYITKMHHRSKKSITELSAYIKKELDQGIKPTIIIKLVRKSRWTDSDIIDALLAA